MPDTDKHFLNAMNLLCPLPVIRLSKLVGEVCAGDLIEMECSDPGAKYDIPSWCKIHGHTVIDIVEHDMQLRITVQVQK